MSHNAQQPDNRPCWDTILKQLSSADAAAMKIAMNPQTALVTGDEYLDLDRLDKHVQRAAHEIAPMSRILPKKTVQADVWNRIVTLVKAFFTAENFND
jgi:hypothetical protein